MWRRLPVLLFVGALVLTSCGGSNEADGPSASVTAPPSTERTTTTKVLTPEQQVEAAYLRSWDVYAKAVRDLDPTGLEESYAGDALTMVQGEVERLRAAETPLVVQVDHDSHVQLIDSEEAVVRDRYMNRNYRTDADGKPIDDTNDPGTYVESYQMRRVEETWRVVRIVRESYQP